jgi:hypothetical protein
VNDRQLGARLRRALEAEPPPSTSAAEVRQQASARQQRRELAEVRRHYAEVGRRMGSAFAPAAPEEGRAAAAGPVTAPLDRPRRPSWGWAAAAALVFVLGTGVGYLLPRAAPNHPPAASATPPTTVAAAATTRALQQLRPVPSVPEACLETARRGDEMVHLFTVNDRSRRLAEALKAYTLASQACRKEASP